MKGNVTKLNIVASLGLQVVTIVSGFVLPKIILMYFGSNVNGLVASINQFLNYVTLLEGGIGSVLMASLYSPLYKKDTKKVSQIINAATHFFRNLSIIYVFYALVFALIYPIFIKTQFSYGYMVLLIVVLAMNLFFQYFLSISYRILLNADRKVSFVAIIQSIMILLNLIGMVILVRFFKDIVIIKAFSALVFMIQPIALYMYIKKQYKIDKKDGKDKETEKHRWDGLGINTAFFIHSNTDIVILTIFTSLSDVSIYSVYFLVVKALKTIVSSVSSAIAPSFGRALAGQDEEKINQSFNLFEFGICTVTVVLFTCGMILVTPFIDVYTQGVSDANYHQTVFGILLMLSEMIYCYRDPYVVAAYSAGHIKQVSKYAYFEAAINIFISVILASRFGIIGVTIGTIIAMAYRMIMHVIYLRKNILYRPIYRFAKLFMFSSLSTFLSMLISFCFFDMSVTSYFEWIFLAICVLSVVLIITCVVAFMICQKETKEFIRNIIKR